MTTKGLAGYLAEKFIHAHLTPIIIAVSLLMGLFAIFVTPKEEEPQISVPMVDIQTFAPGYTAQEVERKITEVIECGVWGLDGVEYIYSASQSNKSLVTVRFKVGEPIEPSLVKIHDKMMVIKSDLPHAISPSVIRSFSIDDVPFLVLTFHSKTLSDFDLRQVIAPLARKLSSTPDLSRVELLGGQKRVVRIIAEKEKMEMYGVSLISISEALRANDVQYPVGKNWKESVLDVEIGGRFNSAEDVKKMAIGQRGGGVVLIGDIATVVDGPEERVRYSSLTQKGQTNPSVSIVVAKRKGTNVVSLSEAILSQVESYSLPKEVEWKVIRDYGETAQEKSDELIGHLFLATFSVALLIAWMMGRQAALIVALAVPVTLALTLFIYYFLGYTLNRVTLFALIFSIGILVDDAIVVVENIERHLKENKKKGFLESILSAVSEVGNPTILATFTVIAAIIPMAFVGGLMGPYMSPIPVGASLSMFISLLVAFIVTPWAAVRFLHHESHAPKKKMRFSIPLQVTQVKNKMQEKWAEIQRKFSIWFASRVEKIVGKLDEKVSPLDQLYLHIIGSLLAGRAAMWKFFKLVGVLIVLALSLLVIKIVKVKMLPFDNKEEFQILLDFPTDTSLSRTTELSEQLAHRLIQNESVSGVQVFVGEPGPYSFSGLVKHTFLRGSDSMADLQVVLTHKGDRSESSHEVITDLRSVLNDFSTEYKVVSKVLEIPPGPPVLATMVAEIYADDSSLRQKVANEVYRTFAAEPSVVDLDTSLRLGRMREVYAYDPVMGGLLGIPTDSLVGLGQLVFSETRVGALRDVSGAEEVPLYLSFDKRHAENPFQGLNVSSLESGSVGVEDATKAPTLEETPVLHRKNLKPVIYVTSELAGSEEAPVYGLLKLAPYLPYDHYTSHVPADTTKPVIKWDGEWFITYEVFRDLGAAFAIVLILIYVLIVGWFKSFTIPFVIMAPIPISLIGILPGHALLGVFFTATSMIGFIAGAGVIVRNSIILVDFIEHQMREGWDLKQAVIRAGLLRFRPMLLTAMAVVVGSLVMLDDPILQGLGVSLIFGEIAATVLSRFAVPVLYFYTVGKKREMILQIKGEK